MSLSIGTLVGYLQLDDSNFNRKADNADKKLNALKLHLEALKRSNPKISVEVDAQTAKLDAVKAKILALKAQAAEGVDVRVDMVQALIDLDHLQMKVRELDRSEAKIKVEVDDKDALSRLDRLQARLDALPAGFGALGSSIVALGPALIPVAAAAGGLVAALGAPLVAAGAGGTLWAFIAGRAVKDTEKQAKAIAALKKQVDAAKVSLATATTASGRKSAMATLAKDTALYQAALGKLNPSQVAFLGAQTALSAAFTRLQRVAGPAIFGPLTTGMDLLAKILPKTAPLLNAVSVTLSHIMGSLTKSGALDGFLAFLTKASGPAIAGFATILGNIALGFIGIGKAFEPLSGPLMGWFVQWSAGFASIGQSKGLHDFVAYVHREGPVVASTLRSVARAIGHIITALAPIGGVSLKVIGKFADEISRIPTQDLTIAAAAFVSIALSLKAINIAKGGLGALSKVGSLAGLTAKTGGAATVAEALGKAGAKGVVPVFVTNAGFGGPGGIGTGGGKGAAAGAAAEDAGAAASVSKGVLGRVLGSAKWLSRFAGDAIPGIGQGVLVGSIANSLGLNPFKGEARGLGPKLAWSKDAGAQGDAQRILNALLNGSAMHDYAKALSSLPKTVETKIATPGAVTSLNDVTRLAKQYHLTPKQVSTVIALTGVSQALTDTQRLARQIAGLHNKTVTVTMAINGATHASAHLANVAAGKADGGTVPGPRFPYRDKVLVPLAGSEEVISNRHGEADRFRAMRAAGMFPSLSKSAHIANQAGVQVSAYNRGVFAGGAPAVAGGRTGGVDVIINGDIRPNDWNDFMRQTQNRARRASSDGLRR